MNPVRRAAKYTLIYMAGVALWKVFLNMFLAPMAVERYGSSLAGLLADLVFIFISSGVLFLLVIYHLKFKKEEEKEYFQVLETSLAGVLIYQDDHIAYMNERFRESFLEESEDRQVGDFHNVHLQDRDRVRQIIHEMVYGKRKEFDVEFRIDPSSPLREIHGMKWCYCRGRMIDYHGREASLIVIVDTTRLKEFERISRMNEKMIALGRISSGMAHEIRNPLSGLNIYLTHLERLDYTAENSSSEIESTITQLKKASDSITSIVNRVMDFSKPSQHVLTDSNINIPVEEAIKLIAVTLRKRGVTLEKKLDTHPHICRLKTNLIQEVVINLIQNAVDAMSGQESQQKIQVETCHDDTTQFLKISDTGPGIDVYEREKIFEPFYTTKPDGTGIGLSLCHRIITDHQGQIEVMDGDGPGAVFKIAIPGKDVETI